MSLGLAFWVLMILWLIFGFGIYSGLVAGGLVMWGGGLLVFILLCLLGWQVFGPPLRR